ncbi:MAG: hypothetical protein AAFR84_23000 [Pseudomonadota bacterium]
MLKVGAACHKPAVFCLMNGRSGTRFLASLLANNVADAKSLHEPYFDVGNDPMFGRAIFARAMGETELLRQRLSRKASHVSNQRAEVYIETSHSFLKSWSHLQPEFFPNSRFVHLVRDPIATARSEANRELALDQLRVPFFRHLATDGRRYFRWSLTGSEQIFNPFTSMRLTLFQRYLIQGIEIANRAMQFLDDTEAHDRCTVLYTPRDLNDPICVSALIDALNLPRSRSKIILKGWRNRTPGFRTRLGPAEEAQQPAVFERIDPNFLRVFERAPYATAPWCERFGSDGFVSADL